MPHTLLLADDSVTIQRVIELTFADEDILVIAVSDGEQAIARIEAAPPDIILADIGMPGKNGYEVAQYVKQSPHLAHIPVVLLTGAFEPVDQAKAEAAGCEGVLAKPFEPQLVIGRVKDLLGKRRVPQSSPEAAPAPLPPAPDDDWAPPLPDQTAAPCAEPPAAGVDDLNSYFDRLDAAFANMGSLAPRTSASVAAAAAPVSDDLDWFGTINAPEAAAEPEGWALGEPVGETSVPDLPTSYASPLPDFEHLPMMPPVAPASDLTGADAAFRSSERFEPVQVDEALEPVQVEVAAESGLAEAASPVGVVLAPTSIASEPPPAEIAETFAPAATAPAFEPANLGAPPVFADGPASPAAVDAARSPAPPVTSLPPLADAFAALLAAEQGADSSTAACEWLASASTPIAPEITDDVMETITRRVLDRLSDRVVRETVNELVSAIAERLVREQIERIKAATQ